MSDQMSSQVSTVPEKPKRAVRPVGRPSKYSEAIAISICKQIVSGKSLVYICKREGTPHLGTAYRWLDEHPDFRERYERARLDQADTLADEITMLADEEPRKIIDQNGVERIDSGWVQWHRLRIDSRKFIAAKLKPKKYGDRVDVNQEISANVNVMALTLDAASLAPEARDALRQALLESRQQQAIDVTSVVEDQTETEESA